ncbi:MAG: YfhO family protein [Ruminococcus sp.]|nr:YfhO family protein [Ruminococcus sp.]
MKSRCIERLSNWKEERRRYLLVFLLGFGSLLIVLLPIMIKDQSYFIYYGDYNSQQIPFYNLANNAVRSGSFGWNWYTDLGANFIGSYSFYLLGSPFFWLSTLLPRAWVTYSMPVLLCLKHGLAALTSYAYIRRFVKNPNAAIIGGMLYAFSGFQLFNIFFNHFHDVTAFFPLMLIAMEELVNHNRRGIFALTVALMAMINYFFFTGQVVFLVLYFIVRCNSKDFHASGKKFFIILLEAIIGVLIACVLLLPSALTVIANSRVSEHLYGMDLITYGDRTRIWRILFSLFMIPDVPARPNLFSSDYGKWASIGGYLPMFSMAGVIAFLQQKQKHWAKQLVIICGICACIPVLNSLFYALNGSYYARWYYMPILIMAMMTAYALDNRQISWRFGVGVCAVFMAGFGVISLLPTKSGDEVTWFDFAEYPEYFLGALVICVAGILCTVFLIRRRNNRKTYLRRALITTTVWSIACTMFVVYFGAFDMNRANTYIDEAIDTENEISISVSEDNFFRVDISEDYDNYPMLWGLPSMRCFHSVVSVSIMEFYDSISITRDVASRADTDYYTLRSLFSVEYYFEKATYTVIDGMEPEIDLPGFTYETTENGFNRYKNDYYVPMGFTFSSYITEDKWEVQDEEDRAKLLICSLVLTDEQVEKYGDMLSPLSDFDLIMDEEDYLVECEERAASSCDTFVYDSSGFTATITSDSSNLLFFSVPYEDGWSATVNGEAVDIEQVDVGFMAVPIEAGENEIVFTYETPGLKAGFALTMTGLVLLLGYLLVCHKVCRKIPREQQISTVDYTISGEDDAVDQQAPTIAAQATNPEIQKKNDNRSKTKE